MSLNVPTTSAYLKAMYVIVTMIAEMVPMKLAALPQVIKHNY